MNFTEKVLEVVKKIPKGKVTTYSTLAKVLGKPKASRAIGQALKRNPEPIKIPCHRVVCSDGSLGGYSFANGTKTKEELLKKEGIKIQNGKINLKNYLFKF